jgi:peptidoglycan/xylan/chitin deacetylase (PgdA/CDA1 family)
MLLMFHGLTDCLHSGCENCQHKHLHVATFEAFLAFLARHYRIFSLDDVVDCLRAGRALPSRAVVLTFDDGFASNYELAFPLLKRYAAPAVVYLATEFVDEHQPIWTDRVDYAFHAAGKSPAEMIAAKQRLKHLPQEQIGAAVAALEETLGARLAASNADGVPAIYRNLSWAQVREMQASGLVQFGAHTHTHKILGRSQPDTIAYELSESKRIIERETSVPCRHFCYPNGSHGDFSDTSERLVQAAGFESSITTLYSRIKPQPDAFLLPRIGITNDLDLTRFDWLLAGLTAAADTLRSAFHSHHGDADE